MRKHIFCAITIFLFGSVAAFEESGWNFSYKGFKGEYAIYGGGIGDPYPPTSKDKKISFALTGAVAKEMFDSMAPDIKNTCGTEGGGRIRWRDDGNVTCSLFNKNEYLCHFGFDLRTGKSVGGSVC